MEIVIDTPTVRVARLVAGPLDNNIFVVGCPERAEAVVIDAADDADAILAACEGWTVLAVLTTHGHWDHVQAAAAVSDELNVPFRIHPGDAALARLDPTSPIRHDEHIEVGELDLHAVHTPGHSPGSMCFVSEGIVFSGDTLFPGGPGATSGPGADFDVIMQSLRERLFIMPNETVVWPGHGAPTTLGAERPHLAEWEARRW